MCCGMYNVQFLCTLCVPLINQTLIATINGTTELLILTEIGSITIAINNTSVNVNKSVFSYNTQFGSWVCKKPDDPTKLIVLKDGVHVKVKIINRKIINKTQHIFCMGFLDNIATQQEYEDAINYHQSLKTYDSVVSYENSIQTSNAFYEEDDTSDDTNEETNEETQE